MDPHEIEPLLKEIGELDKARAAEMKALNGAVRTLAAGIPKIVIRNEERVKLTKERFNVFHCLTRHHLEELHSKFLYYLLNPAESHDCDALFLETFIQVLRENYDISGLLEPLTSKDLENAKVERELFIGRSGDSDIYGFIDLFIALPTLNIAIENKIKAGEQSRQIERYVNYCKTQNKNYIVLYLTLTGYSSAQAGKEEYYAISYEKEIITWLERSIKEVWKYPSVYSGLIYYKDLINTRILNKTSNLVTMDIKEILLKEENRAFLKYTKEIQETILVIRNDLRTEFFKRVFGVMNSAGYKFIPVSGIVRSINLHDVWSDENRGFRLVSDDLVYTTVNNQKVYFCIEHNWHQLYYGLYVLDYKDDSLKLPGIAVSEEIKAVVGERLNRRLDYTLESPANHWWFSKRYFTALKEGIGNDTLNYDFLTRMDEIVEQFTGEVLIYLAAWKDTLQELADESLL